MGHARLMWFLGFFRLCFLGSVFLTAIIQDALIYNSSFYSIDPVVKIDATFSATYPPTLQHQHSTFNSKHSTFNFI